MSLRIIRELHLCSDCMIAAVNDDYSGMEDDRAAEVEAGIEAMGWATPDFDSETGEGYEEFTWRWCDCCNSRLAGSRHRFVILGP